MIIVKLKGGLGNQLFQYAMARRIAMDNDLSLKLDVKTGFQNDFYKQKYGLCHFNIVEKFALPKEIARFEKRGIGYLMGKLKPYYRRSVIREFSNSCFDSNMLKISNNTYLEGYWQSEKYFKDREDIIRREFTLKYPLQGKNLLIGNKIKSSNSICLHFRRLHGVSSDGIMSYKRAKFHGANSLDYYYSAIKYLSSKYRDLSFFVFADDLEWVKRNLKLSFPTTFVAHNNNKDYEDLRLMTLCKHYVIANSSFSWWGAWLSNNPDKIIFAPKKWFNDTSRNTSDLIPKSWIRI